MESLTLNDGTPYQRHYQSRDQRYRSPRLPTPDTSRSSRETLVNPYDNGSFARPTSGERSLGIPNGPIHYRRDSRNTAAPHSPPYQNGEGQKPSLPPLKTVCGLPVCNVRTSADVIRCLETAFRVLLELPAQVKAQVN